MKLIIFSTELHNSRRMSRIIVKNLPNKTSDDKLRTVFAPIGPITDLTLKYKNGVFRKFGFVGFQGENEAALAIKRFNNTYIGTSKIQVEICLDLNATDKPRPWSKYSAGSSAFRQNKIEAEKKETLSPKKEVKVTEKSKKIDELLGELKDSAEFEEFLAVHENRQKKSLWADDVTSAKPIAGHVTKDLQDSDSGNDSDSEYVDLPANVGGQELSDDDENSSKIKKGKKKLEPTPYIIKMKGVPMHCKDKKIRQFFEPLNICSIRIARNKQKKAYGLAYVSFPTPEDAKDALTRNKMTLGDKKVQLRVANSDTAEWNVKSPKYEQVPEEAIVDTGRLYLRNLSYTCDVEGLEELFGKFGPITEVHLPVDKFTRKLKGFAFVTFMIPEHAFKAYTQLDGTIHQGRILHILPAKEKEETTEADGSGTFKQKRALEKKARSGSSHNWNALFLGASAVADVMAEKFGKEKSDILQDGKQSVAVRMALGETQIVAETRQFLLDNGVVLDSFSQADAPRSKTVLLVKNLPSGTEQAEITELFEKNCKVIRVILPPSGLSALVVCDDPTEAKTAFKRLAYTKFKHVPLYLEWAPIGVLTAKVEKETDEKEKNETENENKNEDNDDEIEPEAESCLFVKNLNFDTTDDSLREHFKKCGKIISATVSRKIDSKNLGQLLSMGYGFVQFQTRASAQKVLKELQHSQLDNHTLEIKISTGKTTQTGSKRKHADEKKQTSSKIMIRNIPFEAKKQEIEELFKVFGEIKMARLPKKLSGTGTHRGFGFVDFVSKQDAKRAFQTLCHSTHLYGRRLILEWAEQEESLEELREKTAKQFSNEIPHKKLKKRNLEDGLKAKI